MCGSAGVETDDRIADMATATSAKLYMFRSTTSEELCSFSDNADGKGLPNKFAPWIGIGVVRPDQIPPHGMSSIAINAGIAANGYQMWRRKK
jgi:hypothetical protein